MSKKKPQSSASHQIQAIQWLRAIAIILVFTHHAAYSASPHGYIGVDMFFAISGFVLTLSAVRNIQSGTFSPREFLEKRLLRLAPALIAAVLASWLALTLTSPLFAVSDYSKSATSALTWTSNLYFQIRTGDYFGENAASEPFLHTWSLSTEMQAYIVLASIFWVSTKVELRKGRTHGVFTLTLLAASTLLSLSVFLVSFAAQPSGGLSSAIFSYYSPAMRFWQIGLGAALALAIVQKELKLPSRIRVVSLSIGSFLVLVALLSEAGADYRVHSLLATFGVLAILASFRSASEQKQGAIWSMSISGGLKGVASWIGDRAYSIYLVHWPLVVLLRPAFPDSAIFLTLSLFLTALLGAASHSLFEAPWTSARLSLASSRHAVRRLATWLFSASFLLFGVGLSVSGDPDSHQGRATFEGDVSQKGFLTKFNESFTPCEREIGEYSPNAGTIFKCHETLSGQPVEVVLIGNSHAAHFLPGRAAAYPDTNIRYLAIEGQFRSGDSNLLRRLGDDSLTKTKAVVVSSFWEIETFNPNAISEIMGSLPSRNAKLIFLEDVPNFKISPIACKYSGLFAVQQPCSERLTGFVRHIQQLRVSIESHFPEAIVVPTWQPLLTQAETFSLEKGGVVLYRDRNHLNFEGSNLVLHSLIGHDSIGALNSLLD